MDQKMFLRFQQDEIDSYEIYKRIGERSKDPENGKILLQIASEERSHAKKFEKYSKQKVKANQIKVFFFVLMSRIFGFTFAVRLLEKGEEKGLDSYSEQIEKIPELKQIIDEEEVHEELLLNMLDEERLQYVGSMVLGMNDALVELTGALAGYTFAMQNTKVIAMAGLITGISATLSMSASGYLQAKTDGEDNPLKSSVYTGFAYLITVVLLILPFLVFAEDAFMLALAITLIVAVLIIAVFNYYISVAKNTGFKRDFLVMAGISLTVAGISFVIGILVKNVLGIDL
ncbi:MAG: vacuolar iron transporter family protein [Eubacteriaceae bacterium]|jgi:VIT1/CCC1 family predicted Fe2+/Mn2+ transporter|nr:vacuolar iron transporter family protein [Eubacteriaceae bacterium]MDK2961162.1 vacuolar iron transporter family protein [Eubacteriaceae bacterium]